jgi:hypothetical protein
LIRIDALPDDVLLRVFDFYMIINASESYKETWQSLVHVCRQWRSLVFGSPRRLNLRLVCKPKTPTRDTLVIWPALPLIVSGRRLNSVSETENIISALQQSNRVCEVNLGDIENWQLGHVMDAMQVSFPELTKMQLSSYYDEIDEIPVIPDSFLGGSAPRLQLFHLHGIPFPGLPRLLSSATHLVDLRLFKIPESGYILPEAMVVLLSALSFLETLSLELESPEPRPDLESRNLPPRKRSILPTLDEFYFQGATEYLEDLVTRIDAPQLDYMDMTFFVQTDYDCPRLVQFIDCTPTLSPRDVAHVQFGVDITSIKLRFQTSEFVFDHLQINISSEEPDWQLRSLVQICNSSLPPPSTVEDLYIERRHPRMVWANDAIENVLWLELLLQFTAVKNLYLSKEFAPYIAAALQDLIGVRITEVLPNLQNIFVERFLQAKPFRPFHKNFWLFVGARQQSGHPITISDWDEGPDMELV